MYIFISIVYFLVLFQTGHQLINIHNTNTVSQATIDSIAKNPKIPAYVKRSLIEKLKKENQSAVDKNNKVNFMVDDNEKSDNNPSVGFLSPTSGDSTYNAYLLSQQKLPEDKRDGFIQSYYNKKAYTYKAEYGARTKEVIIDEFKHNIPKMMFLLLPLCALILMVTFRNNKKYYVEHMIYSFHLHCFIFLFLAAIMLLQWLIPSNAVNGWLSFLSFMAIVWYVYSSLRVVYGRSRWRTATKLIGVSFMYLLGFVTCLALAFVITAVTTA